MENKDQLNQIPVDNQVETQDEKTSKEETTPIEASQQPDIVQDQEIKSGTEEATNPETVTETSVVNETVEEVISTIAEEITPAEAPEPEETEVEAKEPEPIPEEPVATETPVEEMAPEDGEESPTETEVAVEIPEQETVAEPSEPAMVEEVAPEIDQEPSSEETEATLEIQEQEQVMETTEPEKVDEVVEPIELPIAEEEEEEVHDVEEHEDVRIDFDKLTRGELVGELDKLVQEEDVNLIKSKVGAIKVAFLKKTKEEKEAHYEVHLKKQEQVKEEGEKEEAEVEEKPVYEDDLEIKFNEIFEIYRQKRSVYLDDLESEKENNLKRKQEILDQLKVLISSEETLKRTYDEFRELQEDWKNIGMVPKNEVNNLWQNYHFLVERFFDKVKINKELKDLDLKKNLEQKIELCEKAEELLIEPSILKSFKQLQRYHEMWKEVGPVPDDKKDEIWDRFKSATDKINMRRREHYKILQEDQENNLIAKTALCEKAENLITEEVNSIREWQEKTKQYNELFKVWKTIGPAPKKQNDEVWDRFKIALDNFFTEKKDYFGKLKDQQINNYNLKLDLCVQAESLKDSTDWRETTRELIDMQNEWKNIGPVPRKNADKIWKRFRAACDEFFSNKQNHFSSIRDEEGSNLKKKEELIKLVEEYVFEGSKADNLAILKDFQRQWTETGHVPFRDKDRLQNAFRDAINKQLDKLNISNAEMNLANYRTKMDVIKSTPDGDRQVYRERTFMQNKVAKLREDIMLWENNIGFLADSKKANLLKDEFEKKIEKAKSEVATLEAKLKFLNTQ